MAQNCYTSTTRFGSNRAFSFTWPLAYPRGLHTTRTSKSIHPRFANALLNACFASDAERLVDARTSCLWVRGHMHESFDYILNGAMARGG